MLYGCSVHYKRRCINVVFLQDKHNMNTVSLMINFICIRLRSKKKKTRWTTPLFKCISLVQNNANVPNSQLKFKHFTMSYSTLSRKRQYFRNV